MALPMKNSNTFSIASELYSRNRPSYPLELFEALAKVSPSHEQAWDCAAGSGQATSSLLGHYGRVLASDQSWQQIYHCKPHPRLSVCVSGAEAVPIQDGTLDLINVAQAFHWFNQAPFFAEVDRLLKPDGVLAIYGYAFFTIDPQIDQVIEKLLLAQIDPFWASGNRMLMSGYSSVVLPYAEVSLGRTFEVSVTWNLVQLCDYLRTWSAVKMFTSKMGSDPVNLLQDQLRNLWGSPEVGRNVRMPLYSRVCQKPSVFA